MQGLSAFYGTLSQGGAQLGSVLLQSRDIIGSRFTRLVTASFAVWVAGSLESEYRMVSRDETGIQSRLPWIGTPIIGIVYGMTLTVVGTGAGRFPVSGSLLKYAAAHAALFVADGYMAGRIALKTPEKNDMDVFEGSPILRQIWGQLNIADEGEPEQLVDYCSFRPIGVPLALLWFGARLTDGWFSASMPINTLPFMSLAAKLKPAITPFASSCFAKLTSSSFGAKLVSWMGR